MGLIITLIVTAEIFNTLGNTLIKKSVNMVAPGSLNGAGLYLDFLKNVLAKPLIWLGFFSMALCLIIWLVALSKADLSFVFPVGSLQYILVLISAHFFLGEKTDGMKLLGIASIILGITLVAIK